MAVRPRWLKPAVFVLLGILALLPTALVLAGVVVGLRYDAGVSRQASGVRR